MMPTGDNSAHQQLRESSSGSSRSDQYYRNAPSSSSSSSSPSKNTPRPRPQAYRAAEPMEISIPSTSADAMAAERAVLPASYITYRMGEHHVNCTNHQLTLSMGLRAQLQKFENDLLAMSYYNGYIDDDDEEMIRCYDETSCRPSTSSTPEPKEYIDYQDERDGACKSAPPRIDDSKIYFDIEEYEEDKREAMAEAHDAKMTMLTINFRKNRIEDAQEKEETFEKITEWMYHHRKNCLNHAKEGLLQIQIEKKKISDDLDNVEKDKKLADQNWERIGKETEAGTSQKDEENNLETDDTPIEFRLMAEAIDVKRKRKKGADPHKVKLKEIFERPRDITKIDKTPLFCANHRQLLRRRKERLIGMMKRRRRKELKERKEAVRKYLEQRKEFYQRLATWEQSPKKKEWDEKVREVIEKVFPEVKKRREDDEKIEKGEKKGKVEDEATVLARQQHADRLLKSTAMPPRMLNARERKKDVFVERPNSLVTDMEMEHRQSISAQKEKWSYEERVLFKSRLPEHCKNFGALQKYFTNKTTSDCVSFYYLTKNEESYKNLFAKKKKRNPKRTYQLPTMPLTEDLALYRSMDQLSLSNINGPQLNRRCFACRQTIDGIDVKGCIVPQECYETFELNEEADAVCFRCRNEAIVLRNAKCPGDTCSTKKKLKPSKNLPDVLKSVNQRQRAFLFDKLNAPRVALKFCASCCKKLSKNAELLLAEDEELKAEYDRYDGEVMWTDEEIDQLTKLINTHGVREWDEISNGMNKKRTAIQCRRQYEKLNGMKSDEAENVEMENVEEQKDENEENEGDGEKEIVKEKNIAPVVKNGGGGGKRGRGKGRWRRGGGRGGMVVRNEKVLVVEKDVSPELEPEPEVELKNAKEEEIEEKMGGIEEVEGKKVEESGEKVAKKEEEGIEDEKMEVDGDTSSEMKKEEENGAGMVETAASTTTVQETILRGSNVIGIKMPVEIAKRPEKRGRTSSNNTDSHHHGPELDTENHMYRRVETERPHHPTTSVIGIAQPPGMNVNVQSGALTPAFLPKRSPSQSQSQASRSSSMTRDLDSQPPAAKRAAMDEDQRMFASPIQSSSSFNTSGPLLPTMKAVPPAAPTPTTAPIVLLVPPATTTAAVAGMGPGGVQLMAPGSPMPPIAHPQPVRPEAVRPEALRPEAIRPEAIRPEAIRPEAIRPEAIRPEAIRPQIGGSITSGTPFSKPTAETAQGPSVLPSPRPQQQAATPQLPMSFHQQPPPHQHRNSPLQRQQQQQQQQNAQNQPTMNEHQLFQQKIAHALQMQHLQQQQQSAMTPQAAALMQQMQLLQNPAIQQLLAQLEQQQKMAAAAAASGSPNVQQAQLAAQKQQNAHLMSLMSPATLQQMQQQMQSPMQQQQVLDQARIQRENQNPSSSSSTSQSQAGASASASASASRPRAATMAATSSDQKSVQYYESADIRKECEKRRVVLRRTEEKMTRVNLELEALADQNKILQTQYTDQFRNNTTSNFEMLSTKICEITNRTEKLSEEKTMLELTRRDCVDTILKLEEHLKTRANLGQPQPSKPKPQISQQSRKMGTPTPRVVPPINPLPKCGIGINQPTGAVYAESSDDEEEPGPSRPSGSGARPPRTTMGPEDNFKAPKMEMDDEFEFGARPPTTMMDPVFGLRPPMMEMDPSSGAGPSTRMVDPGFGLRPPMMEMDPSSGAGPSTRMMSPRFDVRSSVMEMDPGFEDIPTTRMLDPGFMFRPPMIKRVPEFGARPPMRFEARPRMIAPHGMEDRPPTRMMAPPGMEDRPPTRMMPPPGMEDRPPTRMIAPHGMEDRPPTRMIAPHGMEDRPPTRMMAPHGMEDMPPTRMMAPPGMGDRPPTRMMPPPGMGDRPPKKNKKPPALKSGSSSLAMDPELEVRSPITPMPTLSPNIKIPFSITMESYGWESYSIEEKYRKFQKEKEEYERKARQKMRIKIDVERPHGEPDHEPHAKRKSGLEMFSGLTSQPQPRQMPLALPTHRAAQRGISPGGPGPGPSSSSSSSSAQQAPRINNLQRSIVAGTSGNSSSSAPGPSAAAATAAAAAPTLQNFMTHIARMQQAQQLTGSNTATSSRKSTPKPFEDMAALFPSGIPPQFLQAQIHNILSQNQAQAQNQGQNPTQNQPTRTVPVSPANTNNSDDCCVVFESGPRNSNNSAAQNQNQNLTAAPVPTTSANNGVEAAIPMASPQILRPTPQMPTLGMMPFGNSNQQMQSLPTNTHPGIIQPKPQKPTVGGRVDLYDQFNLIRPPIGISSSASSSFVPTASAASVASVAPSSALAPTSSGLPSATSSLGQMNQQQLLNSSIPSTSTAPPPRDAIVYSDMSSDDEDAPTPSAPMNMPKFANGEGKPTMISYLDLPDEEIEPDFSDKAEPSPAVPKLLPGSLFLDMPPDEPAEIEDISDDEEEK